MRRAAVAVSVFTWLALISKASLGLASSEKASAIIEKVSQHLESRRTELVEVRRDLHRHLELSGQEKRTAGVIAQRLSKLGLHVRTGVGGHGVVATLKGGGRRFGRSSMA